MKKALSLFLIAALLAGCARHGASKRMEAGLQSVDLRLGAEIHREILERFRVYQDPLLAAYVREIGEKLAARAERKDLAYRFIVLEDSRVYATHAPGGYVYITSGFFSFLGNEIELAGILAHEIGALQHKDPRLSRVRKLIETALVAGGQIGPAFGTIGALSVLGLSVVGAIAMREKSAEAVMFDADKRALNYLVISGFDPQGLWNSLERMTNPESPFRPHLYDYLQSHPINEERLWKMRDAFQDLPLENRAFDSGRSRYLEATESVRASH